MTTQNDVQKLVGRVTMLSPKGTGFKVDSAPNDWLNLSQYGRPGLGLPESGAHVEVDVTPGARGGYWVQDWRLEIPPEWEPKPYQNVPDRSSASVAVGVATRSGYEQPDAKLVVTRLACLKAAVDSIIPLGLSTDMAVIHLASRWAAWATSGNLSDAMDAASGSEVPAPLSAYSVEDSTASSGQ